VLQSRRGCYSISISKSQERERIAWCLQERVLGTALRCTVVVAFHTKLKSVFTCEGCCAARIAKCGCRGRILVLLVIISSLLAFVCVLPAEWLWQCRCLPLASPCFPTWDSVMANLVLGSFLIGVVIWVD
jgi:hypothetical protein